MIKEAIEKIQEMSRSTVLTIEGHNYLFSGDSYSEVKPDIEYPDSVILTSLDAVVQMIKTELTRDRAFPAPLFVQVPTHERIEVFTEPSDKLRYERVTAYVAKATDIPGWEAEKSMTFDTAMIALRTRFQHTVDVDYALALLNDLTTGSKVTYNDNGVATSVVTKTGVALQSNQPIRPIIKLKPYRTFQEVDQPESEFLIRINERGITFVEADGGMWKLAARNNIKAWLAEKLAEEIEDGSVILML